MKKLTLYLALFISFYSRGQQNCLPTENVMWINERGCHSQSPPYYTESTFRYYMADDLDTVIDGRTYDILYRGYRKNQGAWFFRADSLKAFIRPIHDTVDYVLYDFSLQIGDTLKDVFVFGTPGSPNPSLIDVVRLDETQYGRQYPNIMVEALDNGIFGALPQAWDYGIGNISSFGEVQPMSNINCQDHLACMAINDTSVYPFPGQYNCNYTNIGMTEIESETANLYPNPTSTAVFLPSHLHHSKAVLRNGLGQVWIEQEVGIELSIEELPDGVYFVSFFSSGHLIHTEKLLIQR